MEAALDRLAGWLGAIVCWCFLAGIAVTGYEVVARYVFDAPTLWAHETTTFLCAIGFLIGGYCAARKGQQIAISSLYDVLPGHWRLRLDIVNGVVGTACFAILAYATASPAWVTMMRWETSGSAWNPPIPALLLPTIWIGLVLMLLHAIGVTVQAIRRLAAGAARD